MHSSVTTSQDDITDISMINYEEPIEKTAHHNILVELKEIACSPHPDVDPRLIDMFNGIKIGYSRKKFRNMLKIQAGRYYTSKEVEDIAEKLEASRGYTKETIEERLNTIRSQHAYNKPQMTKILEKLNESDQYAILHYGALFNNVPFCRCLIENYNCNANLVSWDGETPLHIAARLTDIDKPDQTEVSSLLLYLLNSKKVTIDIQDSQGRTPLHFAVMYNCFENAKSLIDYGASLKVRDIQGAIPLHYACRFNQNEKMIELFSDDLSLFDYKTRGKRPIDVAAEYGNLIVIRHLLQIKPSETDSKEGVVALVQAAVRHHENEVLSFLKKRYENTLNRHLNTLHFACRQLHGDKMVSDLINPKSIMYQDKQSGFSPLMVAIQHRQLKCIKELLGHNDFTSEAFELTSFISFSTVLHICAKVNQKDITDAIFDCPYMSISLVVAADVQGDTPLHICAQVGNVYMTNRLLDYMSQTISPTVPLKRSDQKTRNTSSQSASLSNHVYKMVAKKNKSKLTPLHVAIHYGQVDIIKKMFEFLVHPSSMINEHDDQWRTSLHMAAEKGHVDIVTLLLNSGADAHACDINDWTPLHVATQCSSQEDDNKERSKCIERLVKSGNANINAVTIRLDTPLHIACEYGSSELFTCLLQLGADLLETNIDGYNCLEVAIMQGNEEVVRFLIEHKHSFELMRNAQIREIKRGWGFFSIRRHIVDTPMRKLIREMPKMASLILDKCSIKVGNKRTSVYNQIYVYEFLDDQYTVKDWAKGNFGVEENLDKTSKLYTSNVINLVTNHPLFIMATSETTNLISHPLSTYLVQQKFQKFGVFLYYFFMFFYVTHLVFFTTIVLRTSHPQAYYSLANITNFDNDLCYDVSKVLLSGSLGTDGVKATADYVLKYFLYALIWLHVLKDFYMIIEIAQINITKTFGYWLEIVAVVLSFIFVYDQNYQMNLTFRCPVQWQCGAFGLLLSWLALLQYVRFLPIIGLYIAMLTVILRKFMKFSTVLIILISGFALSFYMVFQNAGLSYMKTALTISGELGFDERMYSSDTIAYYKVAYLIYIMFGVVMSIFVTNLLIGLAVGEIPSLMKQAKDHFNLILFQLMAECEIFRYQLAWLFCHSDVNDAAAYSYQNLKKKPCNEKLKRSASSANDDDDSDSTTDEILEEHTSLLQGLKKKV